jgi:hypothetical protein
MSPKEEQPKAQSQSTGQSIPSADAAPPKQLSPEEQMALYEDSLKETDWGHQPC